MSTTETEKTIRAMASEAKIASVALRTISSGAKNAALLAMADALLSRSAEIFEANERDVANAANKGLTGALLDRLKLSQKKLNSMADGCRQVAALPDPINRVLSGERRPNGLFIEQIRVPLGVIAVIFESRPNVTVDAAILALKAGNSIILRGGSEAIETNRTLANIIREAAVQNGLPAGAIQFVDSTDREASKIMATLDEYIDLIIPRGGEGLKKALTSVATVPVIFAAGGICHVYVDEFADVQMANDIVFNAKTSSPSVCNALETLLVHRRIAEEFLPLSAQRLTAHGATLRGDELAKSLVPNMESATEDDWSAEYLDLTLAVKIVDSPEEAMEHIAKYGTAHSEAIVTKNIERAEQFLAGVDAAAVYVNASTRFSDGYEFGLGAEVGISTQKLHSRGPMGLDSLTTTKFIVRGNGQIR
jgi:glutamate-5-semialdehyde dehydrogenase